MFDFVNNTYSGVLSILSTLFGLSYPLVIGCIEKIDDKFGSTKLSERFMREFSFEEDKSKKGHYHICVNDIPLVQWFREKANEWRNGLGIAPTRQDKGLKI